MGQRALGRPGTGYGGGAASGRGVGRGGRAGEEACEWQRSHLGHGGHAVVVGIEIAERACHRDRLLVDCGGACGAQLARHLGQLGQADVGFGDGEQGEAVVARVLAQAAMRVRAREPLAGQRRRARAVRPKDGKLLKVGALIHEAHARSGRGQLEDALILGERGGRVLVEEHAVRGAVRLGVAPQQQYRRVAHHRNVRSLAAHERDHRRRRPAIDGVPPAIGLILRARVAHIHCSKWVQVARDGRQRRAPRAGGVGGRGGGGGGGGCRARRQHGQGVAGWFKGRSARMYTHLILDPVQQVGAVARAIAPSDGAYRRVRLADRGADGVVRLRERQLQRRLRMIDRPSVQPAQHQPHARRRHPRGQPTVTAAVAVQDGVHGEVGARRRDEERVLVLLVHAAGATLVRVGGVGGVRWRSLPRRHGRGDGAQRRARLGEDGARLWCEVQHQRRRRTLEANAT